MTAAFYTAGGIALLGTLLAITRSNAIHALLWLVVSLFGVAVVFYTLGAPFVAALEVVIYAGAILVLFLFAVMLLAIGPEEIRRERARLKPAAFVGPALLSLVLLGEIVAVLIAGDPGADAVARVEPKAVGLALYGPYLIGVELAGMLLLGGLLGAYHLARRDRPAEEGRS